MLSEAYMEIRIYQTLWNTNHIHKHFRLLLQSSRGETNPLRNKKQNTIMVTSHKNCPNEKGAGRKSGLDMVCMSFSCFRGYPKGACFLRLSTKIKQCIFI